MGRRNFIKSVLEIAAAGIVIPKISYFFIRGNPISSKIFILSTDPEISLSSVYNLYVYNPRANGFLSQIESNSESNWSEERFYKGRDPSYISYRDIRIPLQLDKIEIPKGY